MGVQAEVANAPQVGGAPAARVGPRREVAFRLRFRSSPPMVKPFACSTFGHGLGTCRQALVLEHGAGADQPGFHLDEGARAGGGGAQSEPASS
jgi:hypothetical protein